MPWLGLLKRWSFDLRVLPNLLAAAPAYAKCTLAMATLILNIIVREHGPRRNLCNEEQYTAA